MIPFERPITIVLGRPLHVPRVEHPSKALCQEHLDRFIAEMQRVLAAVMGIAEEDISIKATTTEKLGFVGRKEKMVTFCKRCRRATFHPWES